jgi:hypothetical protein
VSVPWVIVPVASVAGASSNVEDGAGEDGAEEDGAEADVAGADEVEAAVAPLPVPELHAAISHTSAIALDNVARCGLPALRTRTSFFKCVKER